MKKKYIKKDSTVEHFDKKIKKVYIRINEKIDTISHKQDLIQDYIEYDRRRYRLIMDVRKLFILISSICFIAATIKYCFFE